jgi:hypothetical protein
MLVDPLFAGVAFSVIESDVTGTKSRRWAGKRYR